MRQLILAGFLIFGLQNANAKDDVQNISLKVTEKGFEPSEIKVKPGTHVVLKVTRVTDDTCATQIQIKEKKIKVKLDKDIVATVDVGILKKGEIKFACGMDMISGHIIAE
jgi:plastocyanin domain-containing protein